MPLTHGLGSLGVAQQCVPMRMLDAGSKPVCEGAREEELTAQWVAGL